MPQLVAAETRDAGSRSLDPELAKELIAIVGAEHFVHAGTALDAVNRCTYRATRRNHALVLPGTKTELAEVLAACARHRQPVFTTSTGRNWGYGSALPSSDGAVHLSLKRLDRIVDYDHELGTVRLQPGVTQAQLSEFLERQGGKFWADVTAASPHCSVIGNLMERGFGHTPLAEHAAHACAFEILLPDGSFVHSGFASLENAKATSCYRWGVGPSIDGLFTQSNFGVVTEVTIWLLPRPEKVVLFSFNLDSFERFAALIPTIRQLRMSQTIRGALHVGNVFKVLAAVARKAELEEAYGPLSSPDNLRRAMVARRAAAWSGGSALYGSRRQVNAARADLRTALRGKVDRLMFIDQGQLRLASWLARLSDRVAGTHLSEKVGVADAVFRMATGKPTEHPQGSLWWAKREPRPKDGHPEEAGCGLLWVGPLAPATPEAARRIHSLAIEAYDRHGFDPMISVTFLNERCLELIFSIQYDRDDGDADERALLCHDALLEACCADGFYPYRMGERMLGKVGGMDPPTRSLLSRIKDACDPDGILSPGRYELAARRSSASR